MATSPIYRCVVEDKTNATVRVYRKVFTDSRIFQIEEERIFSACWQYLMMWKFSNPGSAPRLRWNNMSRVMEREQTLHTDKYQNRIF